MALALGAYALSIEPEPAGPVASAPYSELHGRVFEAFGGTGSVEGRPVGWPGGPPALAGKESRPVPAPGLGFAGHVPAPSRRLLEVHARVEALLRGAPGPRDLATAASFHLRRGDAREATTLLERASEAAPDDGRFLADLALARRELALREGTPLLLVAALEDVLRAAEHDPAPPEAGFNLALILGDLGLANRARESWEAYLQQAPASPWASLARERLAGIGARGVEGPAHFPGEDGSWAPGSSTDDLDRRIAATGAAARLHAEGTLFPRWAEAVLGNDPGGAARVLDRLRRLGDALVRTAGDPLIRDAVRAIDAAHRSPSGARPVEELAAGHRAQAEGRSTVLQEGCNDPGAPLARAEDRLVRAGSPFAGWAAVDRAVCAYYGGRYDDAWRHLDRASVVAAGGGYSALAARVLWISGLVAMVEGDLARSLEFYEDAVRRFDALGETEHAAYLHALVAKDLRLLGAPEEAWTHRIQALRARHLVPGADRSYTILQEAAKAVQEDGRHPRAAAVFLDELVTVAESADGADPDLLAFALLDRAEAQALLGRGHAAERDLQRVLGELAHVPPESQLRSRLTFDREVAMAALEAESAPEVALNRLASAVEFYAGSGSQGGESVELVRAVKLRAALLRRLSRRGEAERDLGAALREAESWGAGLGEMAREADHRRSLDELYQEMVELQLELRRPYRALEFLERSRLRRLQALKAANDGAAPLRREPAGAGVPEPPLAASLPPGAHALVFAALEDSLAVWHVSSDGLRMETVGIGRGELQALGREFRRAVEGRAPQELLRPLAGRMFRTLIPERFRELPQGTTLLIVPGDELWSLPFGALWDAGRERYLIESHPLAVLPALGLIEDLRDRAGTWSTPRSAVVVADPAFDRSRFPRLSRLPGALASARGIQEWFRTVRILRSEDATVNNVLAALNEAEMVHFAGHAIAGPEAAGVGGLLVAPTGATHRAAGALITAGDIAPRALGVRLLVLQGCRTALGSWAASEDVGGLAGSLVAAGVPGVVATLWDVEDAAAQSFSRELYESVASGAPPTVALHRTVRALLATTSGDGAHPADWAAYALIGYPYPSDPSS